MARMKKYTEIMVGHKRGLSEYYSYVNDCYDGIPFEVFGIKQIGKFDNYSGLFIPNRRVVNNLSFGKNFWKINNKYLPEGISLHVDKFSGKLIQ